MKLKNLMVVAVVVALSFFTGSLYAAQGDFIVDGNLGVGTSTPAEKAEINGNMKVNQNMTVQGNLSTGGTTTLGGNTAVGGSMAVQGTLSTGGATTLGGNTTVHGTLSTSATTTLGGNTTVQGNLSATGNAIVNGNVGVGTATPTQKLEVNGAVKATGYYSGNTAGVSGLVSFAPYGSWGWGTCQNWGTYPTPPFNGCGCYLNIVGGLIAGVVFDNSGCPTE